MMNETDFINAFCSLTPEKQTALEEFLRASGNGVASARESISNEEIRNEFTATLRANGMIA